jgi:3-oxoacyl-ACP reductase-like protein
MAVLEQQLTQQQHHEQLLLQLQPTAAQQQNLHDPDSSMFAGKVVVITGAAKGIGEAAALAFAKRGAQLLLTDLDAAAAEAAAERCRAAGSPKVRRGGLVRVMYISACRCACIV